MSGTPAIFKTRIFLYLAFLVAILDLYQLLVRDQLFTIAAMIVVGYLVSRYNKNMTVILVLALSVSHLMEAIGMSVNQPSSFGNATFSSWGGGSEGMENQGDNQEDQEDKEKKDKANEDKTKEEDNENMESGPPPVGVAADEMKRTFSELKSTGDSSLQGLNKEASDLLKIQESLLENMKKLKPMMENMKNPNANTKVSENFTNFMNVESAYKGASFQPKP